MATRVLPGAYVTLNDLSQFPEGATSLTVGYVLKCNRGETDKPFLVTSPSDFLAKTTLTGVPSVSDDPTYWSVLKVLANTNQVYIARAANNPLYGGAILGATADYGYVTAAVASAKTITVSGTAPTAGERIMVTGTGAIDGVYTVVSVEGKVATVKESVPKDYPAENGTAVSTSKVAKAPVQPLPNQKIADVVQATGTTHTFKFEGNLVKSFAIGGQFEITGAAETGNNNTFTVESISTTEESNTVYTSVVVKETVTNSGSGAKGAAYNFGLTEAQVKALEAGTFTFGSELMRIVGVNPGSYNGQLGYTIVSWADQDRQGELVYEDTMQLTVFDMNTGESLETFTFSLDETAKTIDGVSLYYGNVVNQASSYIRIYNKPGNTTLPNSTFEAPVKGGNGTNGGEVNADVLTNALKMFQDKTIPVSIIGNGCSAQAETQQFQTELIKLADDRKDLMVFLNSRSADEGYTINSEKAQHIVDYKKGTLASTSFYGTMYAPHVKTSDTFNTRQVKIGSDAVAIAGWLNVINNLNYPYAYAGPQNGLVSGVTCDWKIGDESGEAQLLNDASINFIAYDGKVGRYYMQCQNTLQIANSSLRNIGCVLNVLDIKEHMATSLKEYGQLPITNVLRRDILNTMNDYLSPMMGTRFYNYSFQDVTTDADIAQDTLRYLLTISLTRYASKIYCAINVVNSTFDFSLLASV